MTPLTRRPVRRLLAASAVVLAIVSAGCGGGGSTAAGEAGFVVSDAGPAAAVVAGQRIPVSLLDAAAAELAERSPSGADATELRREALRGLVMAAELRLEAAERGVRVDQAEVDAEVSKRTGGDPLAPAPSDLERQRIADTLLQDKLRQQIAGPPAEVTDAEIERFYREHRALLSVPSSRVAIVLRSEQRAPLARIAAGARSAGLAPVIATPDAAPDGVNGGQLSYVANGSDPKLDDAVAAARTGELIGPRPAAFGGFVLIQPVGPVVAAKTPTLAEARQQIAQLITDERTSAAWTSFQAQVVGEYQGKVEFAEGEPVPPAPPAPEPATSDPGSGG